MEATALEQAEANLNAAEQAGAEGQSQQQTQDQSANDADSQSAANTDPYKAEIAELKTMLNQMRSELGGTRSLRSEFDKLKASQTQQTQQAPKSWAELDDQSKKVTTEILDHYFNEKWGKKFEGYDSMQSTYQEQQSLARVGDLAREHFGADFDKYNPIMGDIYEALKKAEKAGNEEATKFLVELKTTDSAAYRLFGMAQQELAKSIQFKNENVTKQQEEKAKRASVQVGGGKTAPTNVDKMGLPKKGSEGRLEAMESMLDKLEAQKQG